MALLFAAFFLPGIVGQFSGFDRSAFGNPLYDLRLYVTAVPQILLLIFVLRVQSPKLVLALGIRRFRGPNFVATVLVTVGLFALLLPTESLVSSIAGGAGSPGALGQHWTLPSPWIVPLLALSTLVIGYREELFFRAYLISRLGHIKSPIIGTIALSTALFAVGHAYEGPAGIAVACVTGVYFSVIFLYRRNLHEIGIAHAAYNFLALLLSGVQ